MPDRLVVLGGNAGAMGAATQAKRLRPDLEVVAFERGEHTSYSACGIPYFVGNEVESLDRLVARSPEEHRGARHRRPASARGRRHRPRSSGRACARSGRGEGRRGTVRSARHRAWAHGPSARRSRGSTCPSCGAWPRSRTARRSSTKPNRCKCKKVVVVGGGYIGLEMAEAFTRWGASRGGARQRRSGDAHARPRHGEARLRRDGAARPPAAPRAFGPPASRKVG